MSEQVIFIRNQSTCADLGIPEGARPGGGKRECIIHGHPVYIPAQSVYTDANGSVFRTLKADSDRFFMNCDDPEEPIRLGVPAAFRLYVDKSGKEWRGDNEEMPLGCKFVGFFGVLRCVFDDSKNRAGILDATANRVESIRHMQRLEADCVRLQNENVDLQTKVDELQAIIQKQRAEILVLRSRTGDDEAKRELARLEEEHKKGKTPPADKPATTDKAPAPDKAAAEKGTKKAG